MAKNECPLCGGSLEMKLPTRGYGFKWLICQKKGNDPNCKGRVHAGYQKKEAGTASQTAPGNVPVHPVPDKKKKGKRSGKPAARPVVVAEPKRPWYDRSIL